MILYQSNAKSNAECFQFKVSLKFDIWVNTLILFLLLTALAFLSQLTDSLAFRGASLYIHF